MSQTNNNRSHLNSWSLMSFARSHGKMQVGHFTNSETGEKFASCVFTDADGNRVFVGFSSKMGELTPIEIAAQKDNLQVVQLESGNFSLCKKGKGANNWEDVDLGI